jgi:ABC-type multidrug transport system fused ATPase/permease subunit
LVIDEGKILQRGRHDELVKQGWYYQKMLELQSAF